MDGSATVEGFRIYNYQVHSQPVELLSIFYLPNPPNMCWTFLNFWDVFDIFAQAFILEKIFVSGFRLRALEEARHSNSEVLLRQKSPPQDNSVKHQTSLFLCFHTFWHLLWIWSTLLSFEQRLGECFAPSQAVLKPLEQPELQVKAFKSIFDRLFGHASQNGSWSH